MEEMQLMGAREAGKILGVNANMIYKLWYAGKLDYWRLNGTMKTNLTAISEFLNRYRNVDMTALVD